MRMTVTCSPHEWSLAHDGKDQHLAFFDPNEDADVIINLRHLPQLAKLLEMGFVEGE